MYFWICIVSLLTKELDEWLTTYIFKLFISHQTNTAYNKILVFNCITYFIFSKKVPDLHHGSGSLWLTNKNKNWTPPLLNPCTQKSLLNLSKDYIFHHKGWNLNFSPPPAKPSIAPLHSLSAPMISWSHSFALIRSSQHNGRARHEGSPQ